MICPKCNGDMLKSYIQGKFSGVREDGVYDGVETNRYMCKDCGYIEEYAVEPQFYIVENDKK